MNDQTHPKSARMGGRAARRAARAAKLADHLRPIRPGLTGGAFRPLTEAQMRRIHTAALELLETVGLADAPASGIAALTAAGAELGADGRLRFPPALIEETIAGAINSEMFAESYADVFKGDERWRSLPTPEGNTFTWDEDSTYVRKAPYFDGMPEEPTPVTDIEGARVLLKIGDSVTTDHISPAGAFPHHGPAGQYLMEGGVQPRDFNSFGSRRGNHEVMVRGTFANVRLRNQIAPGTEGGFTTHFPSGEVTSIYEASNRYQNDGTPLVVLAGSQYGTGSSRDWAAKGTLMLGIRAVFATSFERIHRSNLVGMGVLPLTFPEGEDADSLGLDGTEAFDIPASADLEPFSSIRVTATKADGSVTEFDAVVRLDTPVEVDYYRNGGILQAVLRNLAEA